MKMIQRIFLSFALLFITTSGSFAQNSLAGREYHNANILADKIVSMAASDIQEVKEKYIAEQEEKKGRKLNAKELADAEKEFDKQMTEAKSILNAMKTAITIEFTTATEGVTRMKMTIDEDILKKAGVSWLKRKALKATASTMPDSEKFTYTVDGNLVIFKDKQETDTFRLADDGKSLIGKIDKDKVTLKRTK